MATSPRQMFLTHYSRVTGVADCAERLLAMMDATVGAALAQRDLQVRDENIDLAEPIDRSLSIAVPGGRHAQQRRRDPSFGQTCRDGSALNRRKGTLPRGADYRCGDGRKLGNRERSKRLENGSSLLRLSFSGWCGVRGSSNVTLNVAKRRGKASKGL
jgi:hypothetical protein